MRALFPLYMRQCDAVRNVLSELTRFGRDNLRCLCRLRREDVGGEFDIEVALMLMRCRHLVFRSRLL